MDALNSQSKKQTSIFSCDYELCLYTCEIVKEWFIMQTNSFELMINLIFITTKNLKTTKKKRKMQTLSLQERNKDTTLNAVHSTSFSHSSPIQVLLIKRNQLQ